MIKRKDYSKWSRRIERNILVTYAHATAVDKDLGLHWYAHANAECSAISFRYGVPFERVVGVVAAISPGLEWGRNLIEADEVVMTFAAGQPIPVVGVYGKGNVDKAIRILNGEDPLVVFPLTSPKVRAFYQCILDPWESNEVVVDRHAKALAYNLGSTRNGSASNDKLSVVRPAEYPYLSWHYRKLAERLGLIPHQLQAICWVTWKRLEGNLNESEDV